MTSTTDPTTMTPQGGEKQQQQQPKVPRTLACVLCQHRKIKCDRNIPCSNCTKSNVPCTPSMPAPLRKRRRPNQDLQERLARCEALLKHYASIAGPLPPDVLAKATAGVGGSDAASPDSLTASHAAASTAAVRPLSQVGASSASPSPAPTSNSDQSAAHAKSAGKLVVEDGSVKFMDSYLWSIVHENLSAMRSILETEGFEEETTHSSSAPTPDDNVDLLFNDFSGLNLQDVAPTAVQIFRLWQVFLERVNPISKIVHVPTLQPIVIESAAASHHNVPPSTQALLFSIYLTSVVALSEAEVAQILDIPRSEAIKRFAAGVKAALTQADFLRRYEMVSLQALVLFLSSFERRYDQHATWIWSGLLLRIAHKIGLHRDGELLGLPPFETEMRRRLWWQMIMRDSKYAMSSGFRDILLPTEWDTKMPSNINDASLFPGSTELQPSEGPTEMVLVLMIYTVASFRNQRFIDREQRILADQDVEPGTPEHKEFLKLLDEFKGWVDSLEAKLIDLERYADVSAGPAHAMALDLRPAFLSRIRTMMTPMRELPEWGGEVKNSNDNIYRVSLVVHEVNLQSYEALSSLTTLWFAKSYFQLNSFLFLITQSLRRPQLGSFADRVWKVIDRMYFYHEEFWDMSLREYSRMALLVLKAWRAREAALSQAGITHDVPVCVPKLMDAAVPQGGSSGSSSLDPSPMQQERTGMTPMQGIPEPQFDAMHTYMDTSGLDWGLWAGMDDAPMGNLQGSAATVAAFAPFGNFSAPGPMDGGGGW